MGNLINRARSNEPLTAKERALLTAIKNIVVGSVGTAGSSLVEALISGQVFNRSLVIGIVMTCFYTIVQGIRKYLNSHLDHNLEALLAADKKQAYQSLWQHYTGFPDGEIEKK